MENYAPGCELADPRSTPVSGDQGGSSAMCLITMAWQQTHGRSALQFIDPLKSSDFSSVGLKLKETRCRQINSFQSAELKPQRGRWRFFTHTLEQQQGADIHFADTCSDFAPLGVIYSVTDKSHQNGVLSLGHRSQ